MMKRRMALPSIAGREDPIYKSAEKPYSDPAHNAAFILLYGLGDNAKGLENVAEQYQKRHRLPYMHWIIPNAREHRDAMTTAWYMPHGFSPFPPERPELALEEDEEGLLESVKYVESLIDACIAKSIPPSRIVLDGFSQGCTLALLLDLTSKKYGGKLGGIVELMGYLPLANGRRIDDLRAHSGLPIEHGDKPILLARGQADQLIPYRIWKQTVNRLGELGVAKDHFHVYEFEGLGHSLSGPVVREVCTFIERYVPALED